MSWNYRVLAHKYPDSIEFRIHEVFNTKGKPDSYSTEAQTVEGDSIASLLFTLNAMKRALLEPILWAGDRWPEEFIYDDWEKSEKAKKDNNISFGSLSDMKQDDMENL
jgi:hypothetical protein